MAQSLPLILSTGLFDSNNKFPGITRTQLRLVTTYELEYFFAPGGITIVNGKEYPIQPGKLLLAKPGDIRCSQLPFQCKYIHFTLSDPAVCEAVNHCTSFLTVRNPSETAHLFQEISELHYSANPLDRLTSCAKLISLLHSLQETTIEDKSTVSQAQKYIEANFKEDLTVEQIAEACNVSASYLHRLFRTFLHTTPGEFLLNCRISAACNFLINTSLTLGQIAFECGFHSQSYFSDCFKRKAGISPKNFRENSTYPL